MTPAVEASYTLADLLSAYPAITLALALLGGVRIARDLIRIGSWTRAWVIASTTVLRHAIRIRREDDAARS